MTGLTDLHQLLDPLATELSLSFAPAAQLLQSVLKENHKVLACGNGGSATQASHLAAELVVRYQTDRPSFGAIALLDSAVMTACSNDYGYARVFSRQIEGIGRPGDLLVALSTSGMSKNVLEAIATAKHRGLRTLGISGKVGLNCDVDVRIPSTHTARIQECTLLIIHLLCESLDHAST